MTPLQWALLVVGAVAVIAIYVVSRRERSGGAHAARHAPYAGSQSDSTAEGGLPAKDQMDMFPRMGEFDELGVGKPRKRIMPSAGPVPARAEAGAGGNDNPAGQGAGPATGGATPDPAAPAAAQETPIEVEEKLVALLIAEREGTAIFGPKIHAALRSQGLTFGERRIYHRTDDNQIVFSVASLIKPGVLDPAEQEGFSTPGLTLFMVLPGPVGARAAVNDLIGTARSLARRLNAEVFDSERQLLTPESEAALKADVDDWARRQGLGPQ